MKPKSANGVEGHLICSFNGNYYFRVYNGTDFVDYDLTHSDLCVTITDSDAFFYTDTNQNRLDHSPATLGHEQ
jgi:hypothetical protein